MNTIKNWIVGLCLFCLLSNSTLVFGQLSDGGGQVDCFSQSRIAEDFDYYDCSNCKKVDGRMGFGSTLKCTT
jgi:hypothetical protein